MSDTIRAPVLQASHPALLRIAADIQEWPERRKLYGPRTLALIDQVLTLLDTSLGDELDLLAFNSVTSLEN